MRTNAKLNEWKFMFLFNVINDNNIVVFIAYKWSIKSFFILKWVLRSFIWYVPLPYCSNINMCFMWMVYGSKQTSRSKSSSFYIYHVVQNYAHINDISNDLSTPKFRGILNDCPTILQYFKTTLNIFFVSFLLFCKMTPLFSLR